jgi:6-phospho-beta-glucosidase
MAEMGFTVFRTHCLEPSLLRDELTPNEEGIAFYRCSRSAKSTVLSRWSRCHFDVPMHLVTEYGSWRNRKMVEFFTRYARTCFEAFDGLVKVLADLQRNQHYAAQPVLRRRAGV